MISKLALLHANFAARVYTYLGICHVCGGVFVYKSHNSIFRRLLDKAFFDCDFAYHVSSCINGRVESFVNQTE